MTLSEFDYQLYRVDSFYQANHPRRLCCVARAGGMVERSHVGESDGERQLIERRR